MGKHKEKEYKRRKCKHSNEWYEYVVNDENKRPVETYRAIDRINLKCPECGEIANEVQSEVVRKIHRMGRYRCGLCGKRDLARIAREGIYKKYGVRGYTVLDVYKARFKRDKDGKADCSICKKVLPIDEFYTSPDGTKHWRCINCRRIYDRGFRKEYNKIRMKNPINKLKARIRERMNKALKGKVKAGSGVKDLGCSVDFLKHYIESKFEEGMTWDNYGEWHVDHIIPLSTFNLEVRSEYLKACHYTNLQPLWAKDNLSKGNKLDWKKKAG